MSNKITWAIDIEYGPTSADYCKHEVIADTAHEALKEAENWAKNNNIIYPMFSRPVVIAIDNRPDDWTEEEEEAFNNIKK